MRHLKTRSLILFSFQTKILSANCFYTLVVLSVVPENGSNDLKLAVRYYASLWLQRFSDKVQLLRCSCLTASDDRHESFQLEHYSSVSNLIRSHLLSLFDKNCAGWVCELDINLVDGNHQMLASLIIKESISQACFLAIFLGDSYWHPIRKFRSEKIRQNPDPGHDRHVSKGYRFFSPERIKKT